MPQLAPRALSSSRCLKGRPVCYVTARRHKAPIQLCELLSTDRRTLGISVPWQHSPAHITPHTNIQAMLRILTQEVRHSIPHLFPSLMAPTGGTLICRGATPNTTANPMDSREKCSWSLPWQPPALTKNRRHRYTKSYCSNMTRRRKRNDTLAAADCQQCNYFLSYSQLLKPIIFLILRDF